MGIANDADEKECEGCKEHHLENGVYGYKYSAVFAVSSCQARPNKDLISRSVQIVDPLSSNKLTIAIHLANPTRMRPSRSSGLSGRNAHDKPSYKVLEACCKPFSV